MHVELAEESAVLMLREDLVCMSLHYFTTTIHYYMRSTSLTNAVLHYCKSLFKGSWYRQCELMHEREGGRLVVPVSCGCGTGRVNPALKGWWKPERREPLRGVADWLKLNRNIPVQTRNRSPCNYFLWHEKYRSILLYLIPYYSEA